MVLGVRKRDRLVLASTWSWPVSPDDKISVKLDRPTTRFLSNSTTRRQDFCQTRPPDDKISVKLDRPTTARRQDFCQTRPPDDKISVKLDRPTTTPATAAYRPQTVGVSIGHGCH
jgi:hypothetical protein